MVGAARRVAAPDGGRGTAERSHRLAQRDRGNREHGPVGNPPLRQFAPAVDAAYAHAPCLERQPGDRALAGGSPHLPAPSPDGGHRVHAATASPLVGLQAGIERRVLRCARTGPGSPGAPQGVPFHPRRLAGGRTHPLVPGAHRTKLQSDAAADLKKLPQRTDLAELPSDVLDRRPESINRSASLPVSATCPFTPDELVGHA